MGEPEWLPLEEAFERFADAGAREEHESAKQAYVNAAEASRNLPRYLDNVGAWREAEPQRHRVSKIQAEAHATLSQAWGKLYGSFVERLAAGELVCRAREGSPLGPWRDVPADAWRSLRVEDWKAGRLKVLGSDQKLFSAEVALGPLPRAAPSEPGAKPTAGPPGTPATDMRPQRWTYSEVKVERWYKERIARCVAEGRSPSRDEDLKEAKEEFPGVSRDCLRRLRREHAPLEWQRFGRRKKAKPARPESGSS